MRRPCLGALLLFSTACSFGVNPKSLPGYRSPHGAILALPRQGARLYVELLSVRDDDVLVLFGPSIYSVALRSLDGARVPRVGTIHHQPSPEDLARMRLYSRFPQGVDARLLAELLAGRNQPAVLVLP